MPGALHCGRRSGNVMKRNRRNREAKLMIGKDRNGKRYMIDPELKPSAVIFAGILLTVLLLSVLLALLPVRTEKGKEGDHGSPEQEPAFPVYDGGKEEITEQTPETMGVRKAEYRNSEVLFLRFGNGLVLKIGAGTNQTEDGLILCPKVESEKDAGHIYGIRILCSTDGLEIPEKETSESGSGTTWILTGRTWEHRTRSGQGVRWRHDSYVPGDTFSTTRFLFRIVDLTERRIAGAAECGLSFDNGTFSLTELTDRDACASGILTRKEKERFADAAVDFLTGDGSGILGDCAEWFYRNSLYDRCVIEPVKRPYFKTLLDPQGQPVSAEGFSLDCLYAVSLPSPAGPVTVYFADRTAWEGICPRREEGQDPKGWDASFPYTAAGMDLLRPETEDSLIIPGQGPVSEEDP